MWVRRSVDRTSASIQGFSPRHVARIEQENDVYLSTLARYVAALGGHLEVSAVFPDETVRPLRRPED